MTAHPQRTVFLALVLAAFVPCIALACLARSTEAYSLAVGIMALTVALGWAGSGMMVALIRTTEKQALEEDKVKQAQTLRAQTDSLCHTLSSHSARMTKLADDHQQRATNSTSAAARANESSALIAAAIEEMNSAIMEIGRQADEATTIATGASASAKTADAEASSLSEKSDKILSIVELIRDIAGKTNLLALNATIEAARAGEHGKGFAVVASEVKTLAKQTAEATTLIETQINEVRQASHSMKDHMQGIEETIEKINAITKTIKTALHEETAATHEIARSAGETSNATNAVTEGIAHMLVTTEEIRRASESLGSEISGTCERVQKALV